jgi:Fur family ferric uptake transcriptional regulator
LREKIGLIVSAETDLKVFTKRLRKKGLFLTFERRIICDETFGLGRHFSAETLVNRLKKGQRRVSRSTIYKTVALLEETGFIRRTGHNNKSQEYEYIYGKAWHGHFQCERCGRIVEFADKGLNATEKRVSKKHGFTCNKLTLKMAGTCRECRR